ncbi:MAG: helix-turn-helix transcriptional regulator [Chlorobiales bacterium]|nr:helix-turn-helix transcriptional regulator [Chlorobiales bacterium]
MEYREIEVRGFISNFIRCFWEYHHVNDAKDIEYTILPDGYFDLICEIKENQILDIFLTGVWTKPVNVQIKSETRLFGIRFKLIAAEHIFKKSIKNILNTQTHLPIDFWDIEESLLTDLNDFSDYALKKITARLKHTKEIDGRKLKLFELLYESKGQLNVNDISDAVFWSSRQINRYFNEQFGFPLKTYINILRCQSSYRQIANGQLFPARVYYDQPHYIKEVKRFTGFTPKELHQNQNDRFLQLATLERK